MHSVRYAANPVSPFAPDHINTIHFHKAFIPLRHEEGTAALDHIVYTHNQQFSASIPLLHYLHEQRSVLTNITTCSS